ncbi:MAG TPA: hypothetical protein VF818_07065 [Ktedonobacterales bacterium]
MRRPTAQRETPAPAVSRLADDTLFRDRWLALARVLWVSITVLTVGFFSASLAARYQQVQVIAQTDYRESLARMGLSPAFFAGYSIALDIVVACCFIAVAAVIFARRSREWMAIFVSLTLVTFGVALPGTTYALLSERPIWDVPFPWLQGIGWMLLLIFAYLFPDGRFVPPWTRPLAVAWVAWVVCFFAFGHNLSTSRPLLVGITFVIWVGWFGTGTLAQAIRYLRVASFEQRQQTKWVVVGFLGAISGALVATIPHIVALSLGARSSTGAAYQLIAETLASAFALLIPITIGIAILRHRLFDIDVIINRALVYTTLTGAVAILYACCVIALQVVLSGVSGRVSIGPSQSPFSLVASTLAMAAIFQPLRRGIQAGIDRRFYRRKYDAARTVERLSAALRDELDLTHLSDHLLRVVAETMQPAHLSLWLRQPPGDSPAGAPSQDHREPA